MAEPRPRDIPVDQIPQQVELKVHKDTVYWQKLALTLDEMASDPSVVETVNTVNERLYHTWRHKGRVFMIGNGGSYGVAQHSTGDYDKNIRVDQMPFLQIIGVMDNTSGLTAEANDVSYEEAIMERLLPWNIGPNDMIIAMSGSGNSPNIIKAVEYAKSQGTYVVGMTSQYSSDTGGKLGEMADVKLIVPKTHLGELGKRSVMAGCEDIFAIALHGQLEALYERINLAHDVIYQG